MRKLKIIEHISLDGVIQHTADDNDSPYRWLVGLLAKSAEQSDGGPPQCGKEICRYPPSGKSGSISLTSTVLEHGLADEVVLPVYPVMLGPGKRFFAEGAPARTFELVSTKAMPSGIILSHYKVAGPLKKG
jgi:hypothetical protein